MAIRVSRPGRRLAALLTILTFAVGLVPPSAAASDRHCRPDREHAVAMTHADHGLAAPGTHEAAPAGDRATQQHQGCDHCPPSQCAIHEACGASVAVTWQAESRHDVALTHARIETSTWRPAYSRSALPPTPPPTALSLIAR